MRDDESRLLDILEAIENVQKYTSKGHEAFSQDELVRVWIAHHIQTIGEAAANLSLDFRESHSHVPWRRMIGMRNILVHQYFGIDWHEVWDTAVTDLPSLKIQIRGILDERAEGDG